MSVETVLAAAGNDVKGFFAKLKADLETAKAIWNIIDSPQTRAAVLTVAHDVITAVKDTTEVVGTAGLNFTLDAQLATEIQKLIADAKAGDGVIQADFKAIGVLL